MNIDVGLIEKEAHDYLAQEKLHDAYQTFRKAGQHYRRAGDHKQAALCFASAASCWSKKAGEKLFYNAARSYEEAAYDAQESRDYEYASTLYKHAAINYERDDEFLDFSQNFYRSKQCLRKYLIYSLFFPHRVESVIKSIDGASRKGSFKKIISLAVLTFSWLVWGYGERPARTFFAGLAVICMATLLYYNSSLITMQGLVRQPNFGEAFYFSVITFTTVGYGDIVPVGISKVGAIIESLSGLFIIPLFVIGLSRKYLRF